MRPPLSMTPKTCRDQGTHSKRATEDSSVKEPLSRCGHRTPTRQSDAFLCGQRWSHYTAGLRGRGVSPGTQREGRKGPPASQPAGKGERPPPRPSLSSVSGLPTGSRRAREPSGHVHRDQSHCTGRETYLRHLGERLHHHPTWSHLSLLLSLFP